MSNKVIKWESRDGSLFNSEYDSIKHDAVGEHECPNCRGFGKVNKDPIIKKVVDEEATGWGGQFAQRVYKDVTTGYTQIICSVCNGQGWTIHQTKPIIETKIVGYEQA